MRVRWRPPSAHAPKFWIWTYKIMPDLWLVDLFCLIKKKFHTPPYSPPVLCIGSCTYHQCCVLEAVLSTSAEYWKLYLPPELCIGSFTYHQCCVLEAVHCSVQTIIEGGKLSLIPEEKHVLNL